MKLSEQLYLTDCYQVLYIHILVYLSESLKTCNFQFLLKISRPFSVTFPFGAVFFCRFILFIGRFYQHCVTDKVKVSLLYVHFSSGTRNENTAVHKNVLTDFFKINDRWTRGH